MANIARELGRVGNTRGRICQAIRDLTVADYVLLTQPDEHAQPTITAALPSGAAHDSADGVLGLDPHAPSRSGSQAAVDALIADGKMTPGLRQLSTGDMVLLEPLTLDTHPVGMLLIGWEDRAPRLSDRTTTLVGMVAAEGAVAIDRENLLIKLGDLASRDELTGLFNRRVLTEQLDRELAVADRHSRPLALIMVDLDHFKRYNDTHGHQAGDQLLASVAAAWTSQLRSTDIVARYGGEEFIMILPDCSLEEAILTADHIREVVPGDATCSAGVATLERGDTAAQLIGRADHALYRAKASGRNRTSATLLTAHPATSH